MIGSRNCPHNIYEYIIGHLITHLIFVLYAIETAYAALFNEL